MRVRVRGTDLFFDVEGTKLAPEGAVMREKPTLLCLHGGPGLDHSGFRPDFTPLADVAQLVYLDQRGHGRSGRSTLPHWSLDDWADDVAAFCQALGIERPVVLGTSFGGYVAMAYAIRHPGHPARLILISTSARGTGNAARRANVAAAFERRGGPLARRALERAFDERTPQAYEAYGRICGPLYNATAPDADARERTVRNPDILPYFERAAGEGVTFDLTPRLSAIRAPTLVIGGEEDPITPVAEQAHIVAHMAPGRAQLIRFGGCGHGVQRDDPARLRAAIAAFLVQ